MGESFKFNTRGVPIYVRDEFEWDTGDHFILRTGMDLQISWAKWSVVSATTLPREGEHMDPVTRGEPFTTDGSNWYFWPAIYSEFEIIPVPNLRIIPGLRLAWFDIIERFGFDPRLVTRYRIFRNTTLKAGIGLFNQAPNIATSDPEFGNPNLELIKGIHYSLGVEQEIMSNINLSMEGFYKQLFDLVVSGDSEDEELLSFETGEGPRYTNKGKGSVYGFEMLLKHQPTERLFGWISYTFMKSTRIDAPREQERPFDFDQTHILTIVASAVLGRGWEAGIRFRLVSGNPNTPIEGAVFDSNSDTYWPLRGANNSTRLPTFHQLDVRVDKVWKFKRVDYSAYLDIQNIYNHKNVEGYQYNYDYTERVYFYGLPILPSIGMKLEY